MMFIFIKMVRYVNVILISHNYPRPRGRRVQYFVCLFVCVCVCLCVCYHKMTVKFNYLKI